ncbi:MAG: hypothetical protein R3C16_05250 [Hyphomonadaceae bacterium]
MGLIGTLLGQTPLEEVRTAPPGTTWRRVRPKPGPAVRAEPARRDARVETGQGKLRARKGQDVIVHHPDGQCSVIRGDIFARTYEPVGGGLYRKRTDVVLRYFTLNRHVLVETLEGPQHAAPGDWIMQGVTGELWPVPRDRAQEKYQPV